MGSQCRFGWFKEHFLEEMEFVKVSEETDGSTFPNDITPVHYMCTLHLHAQNSSLHSVESDNKICVFNSPGDTELKKFDNNYREINMSFLHAYRMPSH